MITKLDNPSKSGFKYNNTGSVGRLKNYLVANEEKLNDKDLFFNSKENNLSEEQFYKMIDTNVKGLTKNDQKFYSFTINPSEKQLEFIGNDYNKFKDYVRDCVDKNYAQSFAEKKGVKPENLVWGAIVHEKRFYSKQDYEKQKTFLKTEPGFKPGDAKPFSMHAHVIVSARDKEQKKSFTVLTVQNKLSRDFNLKAFQKNNENLFQEKFYYHKGHNLYNERQLSLVDKKLKALSRYQVTDIAQIRGIAVKMDFNPKFDRHLGQLIGTAKRGYQVKDLEVFFEKGGYVSNKENPEIFERVPRSEGNVQSAILNTLNNIEKFAYVVSEMPPVHARADRPTGLKKKRKKLQKKGRGPSTDYELK